MRIQQRWWLWYMLTVNPSLRKERKHALYTTAVDDDCCEGDDDDQSVDDGNSRRREFGNDDDDGVAEKIRY